jgi:hypothetical protein
MFKSDHNGDEPLRIPGFVFFSGGKMSNFVALVVEDDPFQRESLADLLKRRRT